jgi:hypothetical protein
VSKHFFTGPAIQYTREEGSDEWHPGWIVGLSFGRVTMPVYWFNPFQGQGYFVVGINYEFVTRDKKKG